MKVNSSLDAHIYGSINKGKVCCFFYLLVDPAKRNNFCKSADWTLQLYEMKLSDRFYVFLHHKRCNDDSTLLTLKCSVEEKCII